MQYNADGTCEWVAPLEFINAPCKELLHVESHKGISQTFCEDHRVIYKRTAGILEISGVDFKQRQNSNARGFTGKFICAAKSTGGVGLPLSQAEIRVQVAFHADGTIRDRYSLPKRGLIGVSKQRKADRLRRLLHSADIPFVETARVRTVKSAVHNPRIHEFVFKPPMLTKTFGAEWYACSAPQLAAVADEVLHWDGDQKTVFCSKHKSDCDFVQYAFAGTGRLCSIRPSRSHWRTIMSVGTLRGLKETSKVINVPSPDGRKYCFRVPSGMLLLRKDNCIFVTGNCGFRYDKHSHYVIQANGTLRFITGKLYKPRKVTRRDGDDKRWERAFWGARKNGSRTFEQIYAWFAHQNNWRWLPRDLPLMPKHDYQWYLPCRDVPIKDLIERS
jgi:hypothetical protein